MTQLLSDLAKNFQEVDPGLTDREAIEEANRCLYCYDAPCIKACPTGIDIPAFIKKIASGNLKGSAKTIMSSNPVGASCARVCPTEELCEGACVLNHSTKSIMIGKLQRYATDWAIRNKEVLFQAGQKNGKTVAVVGGGPAGLSAARELARMGYTITIFEAEKEAGGLNTYGIVSFRLPQKISFWEVNQVKSLGVQIRTNTRVGKDISAKELLDHYDAVVLAAGMGRVPRLGIEGEDLDGVYDAIEFIKETKTKPLTGKLVGKRVVVIGAGNTAIDGATCSVRLGAENVKILYRRTKEEMTAYDFEYEFAKQDGVEFRWLTAPKRIIGDENGKVTHIECIRMKLGEPDADGRRRPVPIAGSEFTMRVDVVIKAIGQTRHLDLIQEFGLEHDDGVVKVNPENYQTSNPKVFACGDVIFAKGQGEAMVVTAAQQGKEAAYAVHQYFTKAVSETA
ncbi:NAD(P)-dependent oxidoreductase [Parageobacillus thermoglucosidasius]|uniref:NAD(P)-dependent oxidoreductase n=2 Tax=Parageobacillus thermoglucosidasius TaxID=1426 RepID=A0AB38R1Y1_PARTM|nr:NAD(P)-dependent oxidoreductase [Parageobacillus thermoglucosidasius]AEH48416.1 Glutamate synthase (NADPH) [Parageobacillus thermoglucosidasius C56-YS93]ALF10334.1 dihydropyrimidine dehydrogenase [Parageobacillus thermoglucosidasius]ANZ30415.1 dihydropyrimidine dehydrogenase [Parageobacillus thermoglucosidasius]APM81153.1 dihydropyrimidine dehydrogenase [Parageobacillus thermoglucosidasius]KJX68486.1 dihydropyrimidine dehydrogenase [Parageobacillus thermoglucosidasius]